MIYIMMYDTFMKMVRTQIYLPREKIKYFKRRAFEEGVSMSEIIRRRIKYCLSKQKNKKKFLKSDKVKI